MAGSALTSFTARVVAVLALTVAVAAALPTSTAAYKPSAGDSCKCARASSAGACVVLVRYNKGSTTQGTCKAGGDACDAPWECTDASPTHVCLSTTVTSSLQCNAGTGARKRCPCARKAVDDVTLVPTQPLTGGPRSGGSGNGPPKETLPTKPYTPSSAAPAPQKPACAAKRAILSVEGIPWRCVRSMNIKRRTAAEAYDFRNAQNNGWATQDDYVNLNFLRDAASRLYLCVTYGSAEKSDLPKPRRTASSVLTSAAPNRFYFQDDVPKMKKDGKYSGDAYTPVDGSAARTLSASHGWNDVKTDGYCVDVAREMVVDFSGLSYVKGLALGMGNRTAYPATGEWAYWNMQAESPTDSLAYDSAGRVYPAKKQTDKWTNAGSPPVNSIRRVTVTAVCSCKDWEEKAEAAAIKAYKAARKSYSQRESKRARRQEVKR